MQHRDELTTDTIRRVCDRDPFRGATVSDVVPLHQRSLCYRLGFSDGRRAFVKRALPVAEGDRCGAVAGEGALLQRLHPLGLPVPRPTVLVNDPPVTLLVTEDVTGLGTLEHCRQQAGGTSPDWARAVARTLAAVHTADPRASDNEHDLPEKNTAERLVQGWTVVSPRQATQYASGFSELLRLLRRAGLVEPLQTTAGGWAATSLFHADVKKDNIMCARGPGGELTAHLVDWEAGGLGDPRWDVGCLIGDYLFAWLSGIDLEAGPELEHWIAAADPPFSAVQAELRAAVDEYTAVVPVAQTDRVQWIRYAAFFLLQRLTSSAVHSQVLPARSLAYLQVAAQLLRRPDACVELLCP